MSATYIFLPYRYIPRRLLLFGSISPGVDCLVEVERLYTIHCMLVITSIERTAGGISKKTLQPANTTGQNMITYARKSSFRARAAKKESLFGNLPYVFQGRT
jgi:hypothetical protein